MAGRKSSRPRARKRVAARAAAKPRRASRAAPVRRAKPRRPAKRVRRAAPRPRRVLADRAPSGIGALMLHMDYNSHDLHQIKRFYTETLGFSNFDHDPTYDFLWIQTGPGSSLGFMPPLPGPPEQWRPPREPSIYLLVEDVDRAHRALTAKGVVFEQAPADMPWGHRMASLRDPEGRLLCLAHRLKR